MDEFEEFLEQKRKLNQKPKTPVSTFILRDEAKLRDSARAYFFTGLGTINILHNQFYKRGKGFIKRGLGISNILRCQINE